MVENWETSHLDGKCPSQVGYVYNRSGQEQSVSVAGLSGSGVLELNQNRRAIFYDKTVTVEDKTGSVTDKS